MLDLRSLPKPLKPRPDMFESLKRTPVYFRWRSFRSARDDRRALVAWKAGDQSGIPPHAAKQELIVGLARKHGLELMVETGTLHGDMVERMRRDFKQVYSIELSPHYAAQARRRFAKAANVTLVEGDSGEKIAEVLPRLTGPALFWLDAHFSGSNTARAAIDTPVVQELQSILADRTDHVIVIDDAHLFGEAVDYPSVEQLRAMIAARSAAMAVSLSTNAIIVEPR